MYSILYIHMYIHSLSLYVYVYIYKHACHDFLSGTPVTAGRPS